MIGGKYSIWIVILQEFEIEFVSEKAKKSLVFVELISELPRVDEENEEEPTLPDENLFLISSSDPWYGYFLVYLQMLKSPSHLSSDARRRIRQNSKKYVIIGDTLYNRGIDCVLCRCLTHKEVEKGLNDFHSGACGGHLSGLATTQKILRAGYYWPTIFKDCMNVVKKCHPCQVFTKNMHACLALLFPIIDVGPFSIWGIDFITCTLAFARDFTKWVEAMPTIKNNDETVAIFTFNNIITRFGVP